MLNEWSQPQKDKCSMFLSSMYITYDKHIVSYLYGWHDNNKEDQWEEGERGRQGNVLGYTGWPHWRQLRAMRKGRVDLGGCGSVFQEQNQFNRHLIWYALEEKTKAAWLFFPQRWGELFPLNERMVSCQCCHEADFHAPENSLRIRKRSLLFLKKILALGTLFLTFSHSAISCNLGYPT